MKSFPRKLWLGALTLIVFATACNLPAGTPPPVGTILPGAQGTPTVLPTNTSLANETPTGIIPVTGMDVVAQQCQFCVNNEVHAVLIMPESASFLVAQPVIGVNCITAQVVNGKRILLCRGAQQTAYQLNVCFNGTNCAQYALSLGDCPLNPQAATGAQVTPVVLTPVNAPVQPTLQASPTIQAATSTNMLVPTVPPTTVPTLPPTLVPTIPPATAAPGQPTAISPLQPTKVGRAPSPLPNASPTGLQDPEAFLRWYFGAVWQVRNYQELWQNYLTPSFQNRVGSGGYTEYVAWWSSVERVDVNSVNVVRNDGTHAWVRVNVTFTMKDGRVISNQEYDYALLYDAARQTWMFDYLP